MLACGYFEATVGGGCGVDGDEAGDGVGDVGVCRCVLVCGEAGAAWVFVVEFFFVEGGGFAEECACDGLDGAALAQ